MRQMILAVLAILVLNPGLVQAADSAAPVQKLPAINVEGVVDIPTLPNVLHGYVHLVYVVYKDTLIDGVTLQERVNALLESPSEETLKAARQAWLDSRESYGQTEAFRFYEGPIDFYDEEVNSAPNARVNDEGVTDSDADGYVDADGDGLLDGFDNNTTSEHAESFVAQVLEMFTKTLMRLEQSDVFKSIPKETDFLTFAVDHDESTEDALERMNKIRKITNRD